MWFFALVQHAVVASEGEKSHGVEGEEVEPFGDVCGTTVVLTDFADEFIVEFLNFRFVVSQSLLGEGWCPDASSSIMQTFVARGVHGCERIVIVVPGSFGDAGFVAICQFHDIGINDGEIVGAHAYVLAMLLMLL